MVAMGGGPEAPNRSGNTDDRDRELLLAVLPWPEHESQHIISQIKNEFSNIDIHYVQEAYADRGKTQIPEELYRRASVIATLSWLPPSAKVVPDLKLIQLFSAGINSIEKHPIYTDSKIPLTTASGVHGPQIAEWVIMMDLVHSHKYINLYEHQKRKEWAQHKGFGVRDAVGKTVGILGYGSIGRQVARVAKALGSNVIAFTASPRTTPESKKDTGFIVPGTGDADGIIPSAWFSGLDKPSLHEFLKQGIDLLVISVPLTKQTTHLLSSDEFAVLNNANPNGTLLANISRGGVIDQAALIKALENKLISGAALDVTDPEPLPADNPLWDAPNVLITPHVSGSSVAYAERAFQVLHENLRRKRDGTPLCNLIDRDRGY